MRFDRAIIDIRPRGIFELLDLSVMFYRSQLWLITQLTLLFGTPALAIGVSLAALTNNMWPGIVAFFLLLPLVSGATTLTASRFVFSIPMTLGRTYSLYRPMMTRHFFLLLGHRLMWIPLMPIVVGEALRLRWSFTPMIVLLERLEGPPLRIRRASLHRRGGANALGLDLAVTMLASAATLAVIFMFDLVLSDMLALWNTGGLFMDISESPLKLGIWMGAVLVTLPIVDLTWFFFYLNARIRKEGWDIELGFRVASTRVASKNKEVT